MKRHDLNLSSKKPRVGSALTGDISNPKGEGSSIKVVQSNSAVSKFTANDVYKLYFKGLVSNETVVDGGESTVTAGFGVAICGQKDNLLYEIKEPLSEAVVSRKGVEIMALIRGLSGESIDLGIRNVVISCDDHRVYQIVSEYCAMGRC